MMLYRPNIQSLEKYVDPKEIDSKLLNILSKASRPPNVRVSKGVEVSPFLAWQLGTHQNVQLAPAGKRPIRKI